MDLTGHTLKAQARLYPESAAVVAEFAVTVISAATGVVKLSLTTDQTVKFPIKSYWDLQVTPPSGKEYTYLTGAVFAKRQITHV